jgi:glycosyltransferase involved in cell wall biosynthesis
MPEKPRVLFFTQYSALYGANRSLLALIDGLGKAIIPSVVFPAPDEGLGEVLKFRQVPYFNASIPSQFVSLHKRPHFLKLIAKRRWQETYRRKVANDTHSAVQALLSIIPKHDVDVVYSNTTTTRVGYELAIELSVPHIWHIREFPENYNMCFIDGVRNFRARLAASTAVISISKAVSNHYRLPTSEPRYSIIYNGIASKLEFELLKSKRPSHVLPKCFRFLMLGQIWQSKGHEEAIRALAILQSRYNLPCNIELAIIGDGDTDWVRQLASKYSLHQSIKLFPPTTQPYEELQKADCLLMCSPREAFGRVTVEAMASLIPVIGRNAFGTAELIQHDQTGLLYDRTPNQLAHQMHRIVTNQSLNKSLTENAYSFALENFTQERYAEQVKDIINYATVAKSSNRRHPNSAHE